MQIREIFNVDIRGHTVNNHLNLRYDINSDKGYVNYDNYHYLFV